jgi:hypothetical protein
MLFALSVLVGAFLGWALYAMTRHRCDPQTVVDSEACSVFMLCACGKKFQYDFHLQLEGKRDWIGYQTGENRCPKCWGWKPRAWKFCAIKLCKLNPESES